MLKNKLIATLIAAICLVISVGCMDDLCGNEIVSETLSPNGKIKAVIFVRDCGATTAFSTQISIIPANKKLPNTFGNIVTFQDHGDYSSKVSGRKLIAVSWVDDQHLNISYPNNTQNPSPTPEYEGVTITYIPNH